MAKRLVFVFKFTRHHIHNQKNMSKLKKIQFGLFLFLLTLSLTSPACKVKEGCAASQKGYTSNMEKMKKKRGKTNLFPKDMRKRMKG
jgi:hypothetical protein